MAEDDMNSPHDTDYKKRVIKVIPYTNEWRDQFEGIRNVLVERLDSLILGVEHVGSTSVPGLAAKPILDIDVIISDRDKLDIVMEALSQLGYDHKGDLGIAGREAFSRRDNKVPWDGTGRIWNVHHHLYVCAKNSSELIQHIAFRDYLKHNPEDAREYADVKMRAAENYPHDIEGYMAEKAECIERILEKAKNLEVDIALQLEELDKRKS